ncbi:MAG: helix-turn-helix domain-containing protein [Verrucomicrobia bacterium]|nr:helix-turn-helix domain-containing protein [Verrucomicrobiota bacterium]
MATIKLRIKLKLSQEEWGDLVGATRESINKQFRAWTTEGLIHLDRGSLGVGAVADVTVFDPDVEWEFRREDTASKAVNNPFYGWTLKGRNAMTIVAGEIAWQ